MDNTQNIQPAGGSSNTGVFVLVMLLVLAAGAYFMWPTIMAALGGGDKSVQGGGVNIGQSQGVALPGTGANIAPETGAGKLVSTLPVSQEAIQLRLSKRGEFGKFKDGPLDTPSGISSEQYNHFNAQCAKDFGDTRTKDEIEGGKGINYNGALVTGFFRGMDIEQSKNNVIAWREYIKEYMDNDSKLFHWDIKKTGQFLGKAA